MSNPTICWIASKQNNLYRKSTIRWNHPNCSLHSNSTFGCTNSSWRGWIRYEMYANWRWCIESDVWMLIVLINQLSIHLPICNHTVYILCSLWICYSHERAPSGHLPQYFQFEQSRHTLILPVHSTPQKEQIFLASFTDWSFISWSLID